MLPTLYTGKLPTLLWVVSSLTLALHHFNADIILYFCLVCFVYGMLDYVGDVK